MISALGLATDFGFLVGVASLLGITALYCVEVILRYALNTPTSWGIDVISFLFLFSIFAVLPHATRSGGHIAVTLIQDTYPAFAPFWNRILAVFGAMLCGLAMWVSLQENLRQVSQGVETVGAVTIPKWWLSIAITYGFGLSALWFLVAAVAPGPRRPVLPFLQNLE